MAFHTVLEGFGFFLRGCLEFVNIIVWDMICSIQYNSKNTYQSNYCQISFCKFFIGLRGQNIRLRSMMINL